MAEVFGVVAAATQLAATCLSLVDLTKKIKGGTSSLQEYQRQLQETRNLSETISTNPLLQTPEVGVYVCSLQSLVNEHDLKPLIERGRFFRSLTFLSKDRELSEVFASLERRKANLSLIINNIQAQAIHHMQSDIQVMANTQSPGVPTSDRSNNPLASPSKAKPSSGEMVLAQRTPTGSEEPIPKDYSKPPGGQPHVDPFSPFNIGLEQFDEMQEVIERHYEKNPYSGHYSGNVTHDGEQFNGTIYTFNGVEVVADDNSINNHPSIYYDNYTTGNSLQTNGYKLDYRGGNTSRIPNIKPDFYRNNTTFPRNKSDGHLQGGRQVNGNHICLSGERTDETRMQNERIGGKPK